VSRRLRRVLGSLLAAGAFGCASVPSWMQVENWHAPSISMPDLHMPSFGKGDGKAAPAPQGGVEVVTGGPEAEFNNKAVAFYQRLEGRRFDSIASYRDPGLREYFENEQTFSEYFANLAQDLVEAHFEHNAPLSTDVQEFTVEGPGRAHVRVRIQGDNGLPMRFWSTSLTREDRWERRDGKWLIIPGRADLASDTH